MPYADPMKRREYLRAYKAKAREKDRAERTSAPRARRDGQWASGHSDLARCLACGNPITTKPTDCPEPKHAEHYNRRRERNNAYRREQRDAARADGKVKRYGTPEAKKRQSKRAYQHRRESILSRLGGRCEHCGIADHRVLQAHHKNGGGHRERKSKGWTYHTSIFRLADSALRCRFKLLCANCHRIEHYESGQDTVESQEGLPSSGA